MEIGLARAAAPAVGAEQKIVQHALVAKQAPSFGHQHHAATDDAVGGLTSDLHAVEPDAALHGTQNTGERLETRALARPVATDQCHQLTLPDAELDAAQGLDGAITYPEVTHLEQGGMGLLLQGILPQLGGVSVA